MKEVFDEVQLHVIARVGELPVPVLRHNLLASSVLSDNQLALRAGSAFSNNFVITGGLTSRIVHSDGLTSSKALDAIYAQLNIEQLQKLRQPNRCRLFESEAKTLHVVFADTLYTAIDKFALSKCLCYSRAILPDQELIEKCITCL